MNYIELFCQSVAQRNTATAIVDCNGTREISYTELDELSGKVAGKLRSIGCTTNDFVLVNLGRSGEYLAAYLGVLKAGCCVVPVVSDYPKERIDIICRDCNAKYIITEDFFRDIEDYTQISVPSSGKSPALLIYTSGSTETPKGILHSAEDVARIAMRTTELFVGVSPVRLAASLLFSFISHVTEYLTVFLLGGCSFIVPDNVRRDVRALESFYEKHKITSGIISPQLLRLFRNTPPALQRVIAGGERVSEAFSEKYEIYNVYGMSELSSISKFQIDRPYVNTPVGKALSSVELRICGEDGQELAPGEEGEIYIYGEFDITYFHNPKLTEQRIIPLPNGKKIFRTGDIGYKDKNGNLVYVNRNDWMIKVNGHRVDPGEIEGVFREIPHVTNVAAKGLEKHGKHILCAYYTTDSDISEQTIREMLKKRLPSYMIPAYFIRMDAMPLNQNGKLDRRALPEPKLHRVYDAPQNENQKRVCDVMAQVLKLERVGIREDFFELGGDSISCAGLLLELSDTSLDIASVYHYRTAEKIAEHLYDKKIEDLDEANRLAMMHGQLLLPYQTYYIDWMLYSPQKTSSAVPCFVKFPLESVIPLKLRDAVEQVLHHYAIYGTVFFFNEEGELMQHYREDLIEPPRLIYTTQRDYMENLRQQMFIPYRITDTLHYQIQICVTEEACYLMMYFCHTIIDGAGIMNTLRSIFDVLAGKPLPSDHYYLYLQKQGLLRMDPQAKKEAEKLLKLYDDTSYSRFPAFDFKGRDNINYNVTELGLHPNNDYVEAAKQKNVSLGTVFVAAGLKALSVYNGTPKVAVEWIYNGRDEAWKDDLVGLTISAIATAIDFDKIKSDDDLFAEIRRQAAIGIQYAPFSFAVSNVSPAVNDYIKIVNDGEILMPDNLPDGTELAQPFELKNATLCTYQCIVLPQEDSNTPISLLFNCNIVHYKAESVKRFNKLVFEALEEFLFPTQK